MTEEAYDKLIIAAGASSIMPEMEGIHLAGRIKLRTPDDAIFMRNYLKDAEAKKACSGRRRLYRPGDGGKSEGAGPGCDGAGRGAPDCSRSSGSGDGGLRQETSAETGDPGHYGVKVEALLGDSRVTAVRSSAGTFPADLAVMSVGVRPNTAWLADSGLEMVKRRPGGGSADEDQSGRCLRCGRLRHGHQPRHRQTPVVPHGLQR